VRIAFVTETWLPASDGIITRLTATLPELQRQGHEVLVIAPDRCVRRSARSDPPVPAPPGVRVRTVPSQGLKFLYGGQRWGLPMPAVDRYLREFEPDVVHLVNPLLLGLAGHLSAARRQLPTVVSYHTDVAAYAARYHLRWTAPVQWSLLRRLHARARVSLATSQTSIAQLTRQRIADVQLWPRGVDLERFRPPSEPRTDPCTCRTAVYVGRLAREKDLHRLSALQNRSTRLCIVGDGPARREVESQLPGATFTGRLSGEELSAAYRAADVFVFPSTTDTLGLVLLEALASGLPVVAADSPASREVLAGCPVARLFPPSAPHRLPGIVEELLASAAPEALTDQARRFAERAGWAESTATLIGFYRRATGVDTWSAVRREATL
jgi:glycosyltransferase involved in cell wall biosynthesis